MSQLQVTARLTIHDGKREEFERVAARCMESVREKDSGTLQYDWFWSADRTECVVRETYRDSEAVLEHFANLGDTVEDLLAVCDLEIELFGEPSEELLQAGSAFRPRVYSHFQSI